MNKKIILREINLPRRNKPVDEIKWVCESFGFIEGRDTFQNSFNILNELLNQFSKKELVSTEDLKDSLKIEAHTINHHIRNLMNSGIIYRKKRKIKLRGKNLTNSIQEMKRDSDRIFERIIEVSQKIDKKKRL